MVALPVAMFAVTMAAAATSDAVATDRQRIISVRPYPSEVERRNFPLEYDPNFTPRRPEIIAPVPVGPRTYGSPALLPQSAAWYVYCAEIHPSFEPETGLYTTYSGRKVPCR